MTYIVRTAESAKRDIRDAYLWWAEHRSPEQALRWLDAVQLAIERLDTRASRCSRATEPNLAKAGFRQLRCGLSRVPTHRAVFGIIDNEVVVYRVRSLAQGALSLSDLSDNDPS